MRWGQFTPSQWGRFTLTQPAGAIAQHTGLTTGAVTGLVDRLEKAGYVQRTADPADRRRVTISILPNTRRDEVMAAVFGPLRADMAEITARYDAKESSAIADFLGRTTETLVRHTRALTTGERSSS